MDVSEIKGIEFNNQFAKVVRDIMNPTVNLSLSVENANEESEKAYPSFITGMMVIQGARDVVLTLTFSKIAAAEIAISLLGLKYNNLVGSEVYDTVMEITNMIAGKLKTALMASGNRYQLTTPFVMVGSNHFIGAKTRPIGVVKKFKDKQFEMLAGIYFL